VALPARAPRVLLVGAYERDNFGDLLFLLVTERYLKGAEVVAAAPFRADMRHLLGREIPAYGPLLQTETFDAIWTVGGQVGRIDLRRAYRMSASPAAWRTFAAASEAEQADLLRREIGDAPIVSPYIPLPFAFPRNAGAVTVLNSVGVAGVRGIEPVRREAIVAALRGATAIAVRDRGSSRFLGELGIEHELAPDAVHALGVLDPRGRDDAGDVAIVQISRSRLRLLGHAQVGAAIAASPQLARRPVRLMLAGTATGHDSIDDYELVIRAARGVDIEILDERRPLALADHIRRARVVIGTSLHARIVAAAYGVPRVSLAKPKPTRYAKAWDPDMPFEVTLEGLDAAIAAACRRAAEPEAVEHAARLALAAHENLERLARLVMGETGNGGLAQRLASRHQDQLGALAGHLAAQESELARLRHDVERLRGRPRWRAPLRLFR
jgi:polysaccharide pyruvyl transferase WcaK-like protein